MSLSNLVRSLAFVLLSIVALFSAYLSSNLRIGDEHRALTTWAPDVPLSYDIGNAVECGLMRSWGKECAELPPEFAALVPGEYAGPIRYLCWSGRGVNKFQCADKNLVGIGVALLLSAGTMISVIGLARVWALRDRKALRRLTICYGAGGAVAAALFCYLVWPRRMHFWIGRMEDPIVEGIPRLGYTGDMMGWFLVLILAVTALLVAGGSAIRWSRAR